MAHTLTASSLFLLLCAGVLPPLFWLWFWLKEDRRRPVPRKFLVTTFFAGALSVLFVLPVQAVAHKLVLPGALLIVVWALIEESAKYVAAYIADFSKRPYREPVDAMVYLLTAALGFASFENVLFLVKSFGTGGLEAGLLTASMRFLGATLLHVFSSAILGGIIALAFCKSKRVKQLYTLLGIGAATILHALFNFFIIHKDLETGSANILVVFIFLWLGVIGLLLFFEKVKSITCKIKTI